MAAKQPRHNEPLTLGDRLISALVGGLCGFATMLVIWFVVLYVGGRVGEDVTLPFVWVWAGSGVVAGVGILLGPERMLDTLGGVWAVLGRLFFWRRID